MKSYLFLIHIPSTLCFMYAMEKSPEFKTSSEAFQCGIDYRTGNNGKQINMEKSIECFDWIIKRVNFFTQQECKIQKGYTYYCNGNLKEAQNLWNEVIEWSDHKRTCNSWSSKKIATLHLSAGLCLARVQWQETKDVTIQSKIQNYLFIADKLNIQNCKISCFYILGLIAEQNNDKLCAKTYYSQIINIAEISTNSYMQEIQKKAQLKLDALQ